MAAVDLLRFPYYTLPLAVIWIAIIYRTFLRWRSPLTKLPYPPGPPERSIIAGNAADIPATKSWLTYAELAKQYGSVIHLRAYQQHTIVINSYEDNVELFEKRSNIYSDRPSIAMVNMMGWSFNAGFMRYGAEWRAHRRIYNQVFKPEASLRYRPIQTKKNCDFLYGLLNTPDDFMNHYRTLSGATIMATVYDYDVAPKNDFFVNLAEAAVEGLGNSVLPGAALMNVFPVLRFVPSWFPGAEFKRVALECRKLVLQMRDMPLASVEAKMKEGKAPNCITAELLEKCKSQEHYNHIAGVTGTSFAAGSDTTTSSLGTFFCTMAMFPDIQAKGKKEIDLIIGPGRLVTFEDKSSLPYVEALRREIMRWRPVFPLGVTRAASSDDVFRGWYIPEGATVIYNTWAVSHDPKRYSDPDTFNPDRFLNENGELNDDEIEFPFGYGRRMCPGRHFASATIWLAIATVLQNFDIGRKFDSSGNEIPITGQYSDGFLRHPLPFECSITPRSEEAKQVILNGINLT